MKVSQRFECIWTFLFQFVAQYCTVNVDVDVCAAFLFFRKAVNQHSDICASLEHNFFQMCNKLQCFLLVVGCWWLVDRGQMWMNSLFEAFCNVRARELKEIFRGRLLFFVISISNFSRRWWPIIQLFSSNEGRLIYCDLFSSVVDHNSSSFTSLN